MIQTVRTLCSDCKGTGIYDKPGDQSPASCALCDGEGYLTTYFLSLPSNVFYSNEILEELDTTEYNALSDAQKDGVKILLMCGRVDLNEGKTGRVRLWNWFGAESTTVANLSALLT